MPQVTDQASGQLVASAVLALDDEDKAKALLSPDLSGLPLDLVAAPDDEEAVFPSGDEEDWEATVTVIDLKNDLAAWVIRGTSYFPDVHGRPSFYSPNLCEQRLDVRDHRGSDSCHQLLLMISERAVGVAIELTQTCSCCGDGPFINFQTSQDLYELLAFMLETLQSRVDGVIDE